MAFALGDEVGAVWLNGIQNIHRRILTAVRAPGRGEAIVEIQVLANS